MSRASENATEALAILARVKARLLGAPQCTAGGTCELVPCSAPVGAAPGSRWVSCVRCFTAREVPR